MHVLLEIECMTEVTVRIEDEWVAAAKRQAGDQGISMNEILRQAIARGLGAIDEPVRKLNLDK